jgi:hypothetical protein
MLAQQSRPTTPASLQFNNLKNQNSFANVKDDILLLDEPYKSIGYGDDKENKDAKRRYFFDSRYEIAYHNSLTESVGRYFCRSRSRSPQLLSRRGSTNFKHPLPPLSHTKSSTTFCHSSKQQKTFAMQAE